MNEASRNPADGKSGIGETITTALRQPSFLRVMLLLAALVVVFAGMRLAAPDPRPHPLRCGPGAPVQPDLRLGEAAWGPYPLALVIMLVGLTVLFLGIAGILGVSIVRFSGDIGSYTGS